MPTPTEITLEDSLIGKTFGRLTVTEKHGSVVTCVCSCGNTKTLKRKKLTRRDRYAVRSCGCLMTDYLNRGKFRNRYGGTYSSFQCMTNRCKPGCSDKRVRKYYVDAGIKVCNRWRGKGGFMRFLSDMGARPVGATLDRIDPFGDYTPENCRWATKDQQSNNKRNSRVILIDGIRMTACELARASGVKYDTAWYYISAFHKPKKLKRKLDRFLAGKNVSLPS